MPACGCTETAAAAGPPAAAGGHARPSPPRGRAPVCRETGAVLGSAADGARHGAAGDETRMQARELARARARASTDIDTHCARRGGGWDEAGGGLKVERGGK